MGEDIRFPIGALFSILGVILVIYGIATNQSDTYSPSLGMNVNLWTGIGMLLFGSWFLIMAYRKRKAGKN